MMQKRTLKFYTALILIFTVLLIRIYTVMRSDSGMTVLSSGRHYSVRLTSQRGDIVDRSGLSLLEGGTDTYAVCMPPLKGGSYAIKRLAEASGKSEKQITDLNSGGLPFALRVNDRDLRLENVALLELPRRAPSDCVAAHILGYTDADGAGVCGTERAFEEYLSGDESICASVTISARGKELTGVALSNNGTGAKNSVMLTLDKGISLAARRAFNAVEENECGAVVVMDVHTGDLLACESFPSYDPGNIAAALSAENAPLLNRTLRAFNIGSAFKIISAAAILESGMDDITYNCRGYIHVGGRDVSCHNENGHGQENLASAFADSCNPYFITAALKVGKDALHDTAERLGIGRAYKLADGLVSESGTLTEKSALTVSAALANFCIGQGDLMVTPIQAAVMVSTVANGGMRPVPRLVSALLDEFGAASEVFDGAEPERVLSPQVAARLREFMINTIENGTGKSAMPTRGGAGGKTATAQTGSFSDGVRINNTWFVGFYPSDEPKYAIVVLCENGSSGSRNAAPVFKTVCDYLSVLDLQSPQTP